MLDEMVKPFQVVDSERTFHSGWDKAEEAQERANKANQDAVALGIKTRYSVRTRPEDTQG